MAGVPQKAGVLKEMAEQVANGQKQLAERDAATTGQPIGQADHNPGTADAASIFQIGITRLFQTGNVALSCMLQAICDRVHVLQLKLSLCWNIVASKSLSLTG